SCLAGGDERAEAPAGGRPHSRAALLRRLRPVGLRRRPSGGPAPERPSQPPLAARGPHQRRRRQRTRVRPGLLMQARPGVVQGAGEDLPDLVEGQSPPKAPSSPRPSSPIALPPTGRRGSKAGTPQLSPLSPGWGEGDGREGVGGVRGWGGGKVPYGISLPLLLDPHRLLHLRRQLVVLLVVRLDIGAQEGDEGGIEDVVV